jgi:pimeloyl-ACP methyl ester carboxylesterase
MARSLSIASAWGSSSASRFARSDHGPTFCMLLRQNRWRWASPSRDTGRNAFGRGWLGSSWPPREGPWHCCPLVTINERLLEYPEVFKVGVAIAGGYDYRDLIAYILEKYQGPDPSTWAATDVTALADRLRSRLLLIWGELDDNVHPLSSMRLLDAFIRANKHVDVLVIPGADHFVGRHPYVQRRLVQYFDQYLWPSGQDPRRGTAMRRWPPDPGTASVTTPNSSSTARRTSNGGSAGSST